MKKTDMLLIVFVVIFAVAIMLVNANQLKDDENESYEVVIRLDGEIYGTYPLVGEQSVRVDTEKGFNVITIADGEVSMTDADCDDRICINTKSMTGPGQSIVCLPHRVSVEIQGAYEEESEIDGISQ